MNSMRILGLILNFVPVSGTQIQIFFPLEDFKNSKCSTIEDSRELDDRNCGGIRGVSPVDSARLLDYWVHCNKEQSF